MTCLKSPLSAPGAMPALDALPHALTAQACLAIEHAVLDALTLLGRELLGSSMGMAPEPSLSAQQAADIEYASWLPDPGAMEMASWTPSTQGASL